MPIIARTGSSMFAGLLLAVAPALTVTAQESVPPNVAPEDSLVPPPVRQTQEVDFRFRAGFEHKFDNSIDGGGEFDRTDYFANVSARAQLEDNLSMTLSLGYELAQYDFSGDTALGGSEPWEDIHTMSAGILFDLDLQNDWKVFGGPVIQFARESGADWDDSFTAGGFVGVSLDVDEDFTIGGGIGIVDQLEDDVRVFPVIVLNYSIAPDVSLRSRSGGGGGHSGLEVVWDFGESELAIGGAYRFRRFRLDDDGANPNGVAEDTSFPLWVRYGISMTDNIRLNVKGGVFFDGEFEVHDENGRGGGSQDYDLSAMIGATLAIRF